MCTAVAGPALLGLPFAMASLGWPGGTVALMMGYFVTLCACACCWWPVICRAPFAALSDTRLADTSWAMTELCEINGKRRIRYRVSVLLQAAGSLLASLLHRHALAGSCWRCLGCAPQLMLSQVLAVFTSFHPAAASLSRPRQLLALTQRCLQAPGAALLSGLLR